jgi:hypothetical protein
MKYERTDFTENEYVFSGGQSGDFILRFSNKNVCYSERGGLFSGTGTWEITEEKNIILVKVRIKGSSPLAGRKA